MIALYLLACAAPDPHGLFGQLDLTVAEEPSAASERFVAVIDAASDTLHVALPAGEDTTITGAILDAWDRGVEVEVVTDVDRAADAGIDTLRDGGVPVRLADEGIAYFDFALNADVAWASKDVIMSEAFAVADRRWLVAASSVGDLVPGTRVVLDLAGEDLIDDVLTEHNQLMGGADATAMTAYSAPAKSIADARWSYGTDSDVGLELWLGPQERLNKRVIDAVYRARASVWVLTEDLANAGLAKALQDKAKAGFDVRVVVGADFGTIDKGQSQVLRDATPDVEKGKVGDRRLPTVILVDTEDSPYGYRPTAQALIMSHPLWSSSRMYNGSVVRNDQLIDGQMWVIDDFDAGQRAPSVEALHELFLNYEADAGGL